MGIAPLSTAHAQIDNQTNGMNELMTNLDAKVRYGGRGYEVWPEMYFPLEHSSKGRGNCIRRRHRFSIQRSVCCRPPGCQLGVIQLLLPHQLAGDVAVVGGCFFSSVESHTSPQAHDDGFRGGQEFKCGWEARPRGWVECRWGWGKTRSSRQSRTARGRGGAPLHWRRDRSRALHLRGSQRLWLEGEGEEEGPESESDSVQAVDALMPTSKSERGRLRAAAAEAEEVPRNLEEGGERGRVAM